MHAVSISIPLPKLTTEHDQDDSTSCIVCLSGEGGLPIVRELLITQPDPKRSGGSDQSLNVCLVVVRKQLW